MLSTNIVWAIVIAVILIVAIAAMMLYTLQRLKRRREALAKDLARDPAQMEDRAYNRLAMARAEADLMARSGLEVASAREMIRDAQTAYDLRKFDRAYELSQGAHDRLVEARRSGTVSPGSRPPAATTTPTVALGTGPATPSGTSRPSSPPIAKNRLEAQFELRLLGEELDAAKPSRPNDPAVAEAQGLRDQAQAAFDQANYTEGLRLALKGRRRIGGKVETLAAGREGAPTAGTPAGGDASAMAEAAAAGGHCPACGYPLSSDDRFCRGCGRPSSTAKCSHCGGVLQSGDQFCGVCGAAVA